MILSESELNSMRCGTGVHLTMKAYLLLLTICILPAVAGILVTRPMWRIRQLPNGKTPSPW